MERFDEIARGASELRVTMQRGDIVVRVAEGAEWGLDWSGQGDVEPEVERIGAAVEVRQRGGHGAPNGPRGRMRTGAREAGDRLRETLAAHGGHGGIVGEVMHDVGELVDEVGGVVDEVVTEVLGGWRGLSQEVYLTIPAGVQIVELKTGWGRIDAEGLRGRLRLTSGYGPLVLSAAGGEAELSTGNGDVTIERYDGKLTVSSGNGRIRLERLGGQARLDTGNGRIEVLEAEGAVRAHSGNGTIALTAASGEAELNTGHGAVEIDAPRGLTGRAATGAGTIRVEGGSVRSLRLNTMMGPLTLAADLEPGSYELTSGMGAVTVELAPDVRARVDAQTGFGQVQSDFPLVRVGRSGPLGFGGVRMVGSIGDGEPQVELSLRSGKGELALRRASASPAHPRPPAAPARPAPPVPPRAPAPPARAASGRSKPTRGDSMLSILEALARGEITPAEAEDLLSN